VAEKMTDVTLTTTIAQACELASELVPVGSLARTVASIRDRWQQPLRLAIAGRPGTGKSTLLNALLGERLARTGGTGTELVTWYRDGARYEVRGVLRDGTTRELRFARAPDALQVDLGRLEPNGIHHLEVSWPSPVLRDVILIDTPGITSPDDHESRRARGFLAPAGRAPSEADSILYLMRHVHPTDLELLASFMDHRLAHASPVNAIAVLCHADEVGAGRLDAVESAQRIATRLAQVSSLRALCGPVVALAGLVAETGLTFREDEASDLRRLAAVDGDELALMLLSVDRFCEWSWSPLAPEVRRRLVDRLGLFGLRVVLSALQAETSASAAELARRLVQVSGVTDVRRLLDQHFLSRGSALKARSALASLAFVAESLAVYDSERAARIQAELERLEGTVHELIELRLLHLVLAGAVPFTADEVEEVQRVTASGPVAVRAGEALDASLDTVQRAIVAGIDRWRTKAADPLAPPALVEARATMARSYEALYFAAPEEPR
jgi:hypothetical protein